MMTTKSIFSMFAVLGCLIFTFAQQSILVMNSGTSKVLQLNATTGNIINASFIDVLPQSPTTIKGIAQVDNKIWITDQIADAIFIYSVSGTYEATISGGLDNMRGLNIVNNEVWITNAGSANGATADSVVRYAKNGTKLGIYPTITSPFDVLDLGNGNALVSSFTNSGIAKISYDGSTTTAFVVAGIISNPEQLKFNAAGNIICAVFGSLGANPAGIYEFSAAGSIVNKWPITTGSVRGVIPIDNGNYLVSTSTGLYSLNPLTNVSTLITAGNFQFFTRIDSNLAVNESAKSDISFYPNPVKDFLNVSSSDAMNKVMIYSISGQLLLQNALSSKSEKINLTALSSGIYIMKIYNDNSKIQSFKIIKR